MPESWMSAGIRSTPSGVMQDTLAVGRSGSSHQDTAHSIRESKGAAYPAEGGPG